LEGPSEKGNQLRNIPQNKDWGKIFKKIRGKFIKHNSGRNRNAGRNKRYKFQEGGKSQEQKEGTAPETGECEKTGAAKKDTTKLQAGRKGHRKGEKRGDPDRDEKKEGEFGNNQHKKQTSITV